MEQNDFDPETTVSGSPEIFSPHIAYMSKFHMLLQGKVLSVIDNL